jgi:hypothetical protein
MADTLTANCTLVCDTQESYDSKLNKLQQYIPAAGEPDLSELQEDAQNLTLTYTLTASQ